MDVKAVGRFVRVAPTKARLIADSIRGKLVSEALNVVNFCPQRAGAVVGKVLKSAVANAQGREGINLDTLRVGRVWIDGGPFWKRFLPGPMGRATRIRKRLSHITVVLSDDVKKVAPRS